MRAFRFCAGDALFALSRRVRRRRTARASAGPHLRSIRPCGRPEKKFIGPGSGQLALTPSHLVDRLDVDEATKVAEKVQSAIERQIACRSIISNVLITSSREPQAKALHPAKPV